MDIYRDSRLTSSEVATLWNTMLADSAMVAFLTHFAEHKNDKEIHHFVKRTLDIASAHMGSVSNILQKEGIPGPKGFPVSEHVYLQAPRLFSDIFYSHFILEASKSAISNHSNSFNISSRKDVQELFQNFFKDTSTLILEILEMMKGKGIHVHSPFIPYPEKSDGAIKSKSFMSGWWGPRRPLLAIELGNLFENGYANQLGKELLTGFIQVVKDKEIQGYFIRGRKLAMKFVRKVQEITEEESSSFGSMWDSQVTTSSQAPFSDHLMLYLISSLNALGLGRYGLSLAQALRRDVAAFFISSLTETTIYSEDGLELLIDREWLEEPPQCPDRKEIANREK